MSEFKNIGKSYRDDFWAKKFWALKDISFTIKPGKIVGFLGANGAGKTTSLKILMGFSKASRGEVKFSSSLGKNREEQLSNIGYLPERPYFYPHLTARQFIHYMAKLNEINHRLILDRLDFWGKKFEIDFALDKKLHSFSKGMLQRVGLITALIHDPKLIILDEPLSGLDPVGRKIIKDALVDLNKEGKTIFFSSHIVSDIEETCQDIVILEKGNMIYQGEISRLLQDDAGEVEFRYKLGSEIIKIDSKANRQREILKEIESKGGVLLSFIPKLKSLEEVVYQVKD